MKNLKIILAFIMLATFIVSCDDDGGTSNLDLQEGGVTMNAEERAFLGRINDYAEQALKDIDPQKTRISSQIEKLKPIMETLAKEMQLPVEDIFIKYMDLASEASIEMDGKMKERLDPDMDLMDFK